MPNVVIDVHAHYVPPALIAAVRERGSELGVRLLEASGSQNPALEFAYGFTARPFFAALVEPAAQRTAWLDSRNIDRQLVATWPDIYGYGLPRDACAEWHRVLNDTCGVVLGACFSLLVGRIGPTAERGGCQRGARARSCWGRCRRHAAGQRRRHEHRRA
jgi:hypothetical protein